MSDLRIENPKTTEQFKEWLQDIAPLPWSVENGFILDADGQSIFTCFAPLGSFEEERQLLSLVELAVNTCGGFKLETSDYRKHRLSGDVNQTS